MVLIILTNYKEGFRLNLQRMAVILVINTQKQQSDAVIDSHSAV
jgi:hypothetical protein